MADPGSTPTADSPSGSRKTYIWDPSKLEALAAACDRPKNASAKRPSNGHVMAVRDAESNLIYSARHVYAPIGEHHGSNVVQSQTEKENFGKFSVADIPTQCAGSRDPKLLPSAALGRCEAPSGNFEASWFSLLADHRPAGVPVHDGSDTCKPEGEESIGHRHSLIGATLDEDLPPRGVAPHTKAPDIRASKQPYPYPPVVEHHVGGRASLPATEKATGGRSTRQPTTSEVRSNTPQPTLEKQDDRSLSPSHSRQKIPVPVEVTNTASRGTAYRSLGHSQAQKVASRSINPQPVLTAHPRTSVSPMRRSSGPAMSRDHTSHSSAAIASRSASPLRPVMRMGSSPARFPTPLQGHRGLNIHSPPASPLQRRVIPSPSSKTFISSQPQATIRGCASSSSGYPQSVSFPGCGNTSSPLLASHGNVGSTQSLPQCRTPVLAANGSGETGPAHDPNFLRRSLGVGGAQVPVPLPIAFRTPPVSCNSLCTGSPGSSVAAPSASSLAMPMPELRAGSYRADLAQDHALIGRGLSWAPVRGEARGNLGENYYGSSNPERARSRDPRISLHDSAASAYPSSPSRGSQMHFFDFAPSSPSHGRDRQVPPPPPPPPPPPQPLELSWAPVIESPTQKRAPRVGESIVCSSPYDGGLAATHSNLQDDTKHGQYPDSFGEGKTWLRPPFGEQHQVSDNS